MIIDSKKYVGECPCGREHSMSTEFLIIEAGCFKDTEKYIAKYGMNGCSVAIYDENTYKATVGLHPRAEREIVLPPDGLHADEHGVALAMEQMPEECKYLIAVGSGTVHDVTRYIAYEKGIPFVSCPTAASVDGFCSSVAAMTWKGFKKTFTAVAPKIVVADLDVISKAPAFLTNSGFGDMIGKFIALADWQIANTLTGEYFCQRIYDMTMSATRAVIESAEGIKSGSLDAYQKLTYGLLTSGLAMQLLGNSRCASGAEHHISHFIEMQPKALGCSSDALHGEKVGVGTLIACKEYHRLCEAKDIVWRDYPAIEDDYIKETFGERLCDSIIKENTINCASGITVDMIEKNWSAIRDIVKSIPSYEELSEKYTLLGLKSSLSDIGIPEDNLASLLEYSPLVRNRLTLMRLRRAARSFE